jgi:hypothetical protein
MLTAADPSTTASVTTTEFTMLSQNGVVENSVR